MSGLTDHAGPGAAAPPAGFARLDAPAWLLPALCCLLPAAAVLTPAIPIAARLPDVRLEQILAVPAAAILLRRRRALWPPGLIDLTLLALAAATLASIVAAAHAGRPGAGVRDGDEVVKLGLYWTLFRFGALAAAEPRSRRLLLLSFFAAVSLSAVVAAVQYADPTGIGTALGGWWAPAHHLRALERDGRAFGTVGNANYFGMAMALAVCAALAVLSRATRPDRAQATSAAIALGLGATGVVLSGSRGALVALVAGAVVVTAGRLTRRAPRTRPAAPLALLLAALALSVLAVQAAPRGRESYLTRVAGALRPDADSSLALRLERWRARLPGEDGGSDGSVLRNGGLERGNGQAPSEFRTLPGTVVERSAAAHTGSWGAVFRGNPERPTQRAALFQQRHLDRAGGAFVASAWVRLAPSAGGEVELYVNVLYTDGSRQDPYARVRAAPSAIGEWQRLVLEITPDPNRRVDFIGVYLLTDGFTGAVDVDDFALTDLRPAAPAAGDPAPSASSPLWLGSGPADRTGAAAVDNEYLLVWQRYGLLGLAAYLTLWLSLLVVAWRRRRDTEDAIGAAGTVVGLLLFAVVAGALYHLQLMGIFWPLAAALLGARPAPTGKPDEVHS